MPPKKFLRKRPHIQFKSSFEDEVEEKSEMPVPAKQKLTYTREQLEQIRSSNLTMHPDMFKQKLAEDLVDFQRATVANDLRMSDDDDNMRPEGQSNENDEKKEEEEQQFPQASQALLETSTLGQAGPEDGKMASQPAEIQGEPTEAEKLHVNVDFVGCQRQIKRFIRQEVTFFDVNQRDLKTYIGFTDSLDALPAEMAAPAGIYRQCFQDLKTPGYVYLWTQQQSKWKKKSDGQAEEKGKTYGKHLGTVFPAPVAVEFLTSPKVRDHLRNMTENVINDWTFAGGRDKSNMAVPSRTVTVMERDNRNGNHCAIFLQSSLYGYAKRGSKKIPTCQDVRVSFPLGTNADDAMALNNPTNRVKTEQEFVVTRLTNGYATDSTHLLDLLASKMVHNFLERAKKELKF